MDWPSQAQELTRPVIPVTSLESIGTDLRAATAGLAAAAWPTANKAIYVPFVIHQPWTAAKMFIFNGATASGNVDAGIYDDQKNRLVSIGSTAQAGTAQVQSFDIADTLLQPGCYYMAFAMDNTTGLVRRWTVSYPGGFGVLMQTSAFPLPATATWVAPADAYVPEICVTSRALI